MIFLPPYPRTTLYPLVFPALSSSLTFLGATSSRPRCPLARGSALQPVRHTLRTPNPPIHRALLDDTNIFSPVFRPLFIKDEPERREQSSVGCWLSPGAVRTHLYLSRLADTLIRSDADCSHGGGGDRFKTRDSVHSGDLRLRVFTYKTKIKSLICSFLSLSFTKSFQMRAALWTLSLSTWLCELFSYVGSELAGSKRPKLASLCRENIHYLV